MHVARNVLSLDCNICRFGFHFEEKLALDSSECKVRPVAVHSQQRSDAKRKLGCS